jgi:FlaA1/EpsC-like NDP-sugar epimerase
LNGAGIAEEEKAEIGGLKMNDLLLISGSMMMVVYLIMLSRTTKNIERSIRLSNAFVALACFLICFAHSSYLNFITLPWEMINIRAVFFDFGLVAFLVGLFIMFVELLKDPMFKYSPYVVVIGMSLLTMYGNLAVPIG